MSNAVEDPESGDARTSLDASSSSPSHQPSWYSGLHEQASIYGRYSCRVLSSSIVALYHYPFYPGALTALQYSTSAAGVLMCGWLKLIQHDKLGLLTMWRFLPASIIFYLSLFTNSELLLHANVDTFIVFNLCCNRRDPLLAPAVASNENGVVICLNTWGLVLYNNLEALLLFPIELLIMGELKKIKHEIDQDESDRHSFQVVLPVALSCLFGLAISFFGFSCRRAISATGFTVLRIVNKLLTVVINLVIWDKHSKLIGTVGLLICMSGGVMYQQSTSNKPKAVKDANARVADEEEQQKLLEMQSNTHSSDSQKQDTESADTKQ
ncbi:GDP-mannose transporter GONST3 [Capsicum baccatum]|uniref:GDP-mannose transporter GONST3 n=1 Tax=Capsicum baccatum TaxID=33114 RepID=A0A2G2WMB5_CAPBA|nr:GDP-mannose transporter GONST3 [Capsicum baccatum]